MTETAVCTERHRRIDEQLETHNKRLNGHSDRLDKLEQYQSRTEAKIENLCEQIQGLVTTIRWAMGLFVGALVSFFFYAAQRGLIK